MKPYLDYVLETVPNCKVAVEDFGLTASERVQITLEQFREAFDSKEFPVFEIHLHNNDGSKDMHHFLQCGTLDMEIIFSLLKERNFEGVITIEAAPGYEFECTYPESDIRILEDVDYLKKHMEEK